MIIRLDVQRKTDPAPVPWYFDSEEQAQVAAGVAYGDSAVIALGASTVGEVPQGDFITDASEMAQWLSEGGH